MKKLSIIFALSISSALFAADQKQSEKQELISKHEALLSRHFPKGIKSLALGSSVKNVVLDLKGQVHAVAVHAARKLAFVAFENNSYRQVLPGAIAIFDIQDLKAPKIVSRTLFVNTPVSLAITHDGQGFMYGSNSGEIGYYNLDNDNVPVLMRSVSVSQTNDVINSIAISPDGQYLASGSTDCNVHLTPFRQHLIPQERFPHKHHVNGIAFSSDSKYLISGAEDKTVSIFDLQHAPSFTKLAAKTAHTGGVNTVACAPHQKYFLTGSDDTTAKLWDMQDPKNPAELSQLKGHTHAVTCVKFSSCGNYTLTASKDGTVRLWAVEDAQNPVHLGTLSENDTTVFSAEFGPEAQFVIAGTYENRARIWDFESCWIINDLTSSQIGFLVKLLSKSDEITPETEALFKTLPEKLQQYIHKLRMLREKFPRELTNIITGYVGSSFALNPQAANATQQTSNCVIS